MAIAGALVEMLRPQRAHTNGFVASSPVLVEPGLADLPVPVRRAEATPIGVGGSAVSVERAAARRG